MSERHSMRKIREVLRLKNELGLGHRAIAASCAIAKGSVCDYLKRAAKAGLTWEQARELSDAEVESRLFRHIDRNEPNARVPIDFVWVHRELRRAGVTLQLLWLEYQESTARAGGGRGSAYQYSQFCDLYASFRSRLEPSMRQVHRAGEKAFVDYSGKKPHIVDRETGEVIEVELFVMVLGASNYTYAEATRTQKLGDFVASNVRAFAYLGCVPEVLVPDQLRSAVSGPHRYDPDVNPTYLEMAQHYGVAIIPARPRKPKDKAKVEVGVQIAQRWILACLRNRTFFSLDELNAAIAELLERLNGRRFQKLDGCRRSAFESIDRPDEAAARGSLRAGRLEGSEGQHRLPRRLRRAPLQRAARDDRRPGRRARDHDDGGDPARQRAGLRAPSQLRAQGNERDGRSAPSEVAPRLRRVAAVTHRVVGGGDRSVDGERGRAHPRRQASPRAGLPLVHGPHPHGQAVRPRAHGGRVQARALHRRADAQERRGDLEAGARPSAR
jgi:transposase